ncbi:flagellar hook-length control protein FliK [Bordetella petrii]|uniref:flagellar hook-length control protein FliK n=1 Tax=Bordetella petrii TaxID=94624 RepID=UPI001A96F554|nr:flagellar hook-length control protein FliK [Bordetella petrii]MBO1111077.1 flagellar hook-length control protein FliK [Bordetella petrii]
MSVGPSALGTVLVQRLDAVLGTTMAAHANLISGARPNAVTQPGEAVRPGQTDGTGRAPRQPVDPAGTRGNTVADAKTTDTPGQAGRNLVTRTDTTASAPTTLGQTARTILALLARYPEQAPPARGKAPLWQPATQPAPSAAQPDAGNAARPDAAAAGRAGSAPAPAGSAAASRADAAAAGRPESGATAQTARAGGPAAPLPSAAVLAGALRQALQGSGLFYESHLGDLAFGQRSAEQLRGEPQAQLPRAPAAPGQPSEARSAPSAAPLQSTGDAPAAPGSHGASAAAPHAPVPAGIHPDAAPLVRQQLDILANQALAWQGEAWPGAEMEWEVRRDAPEGAADAEAHWATRLKLDLPRLGLVEARLNLAGDQLVMQLVAPRSAPEIHGAAQALRESLQRAGLTLSHLSVGATAPRPDEPAP